MNRFRPLLVLAVVAAVLAVASGAGATSSVTSLDRAVLTKINKIRAAHGLRPLTFSSQLNAAASQHSHEMVADGYFGHDSADGTSAFDRIAQYYKSRGYSYYSTGENIVYGSPTLSAGSALALWLGDPPHRKNILNPHWRQIGVSAVHVSSAPGVYKNQPVTVITTDFGVRR